MSAANTRVIVCTGNIRIIAFDLGSTMAWAHNGSGCPIVDGSGLWSSLDARVGHAVFTGDRVTRIAAIAKWLKSFPWSTFDVVVYETPIARGRDATRCLWGIAGVLEAVVTNAGLPILDVAIPTIKKFATGSGSAAKVDMMRAAQRFATKPANDHEGDAICLLHYAIANIERPIWPRT